MIKEIALILVTCSIYFGQCQLISVPNSDEPQLFTISTSTVRQQVHINDQFSFYYLSLTWPPSFCNSKDKKGKVRKCKLPIKKTFTIHGLWPQLPNGTSVPPYNKDPSCTKVTPTPSSELESKLSGIIEDLKKLWPNLVLNQSDISSWIHQWKYHGQCSAYPNDPLKYFKLGLNQTKAVLNPTRSPPPDPDNLLTILRSKGIVPNSTVLYTPRKIGDAINKTLNYYPHVHCNKDAGDKVQLSEIRFCVNRSTEQLMTCTKRNSGCSLKDNIRFTP